MDPFNVKISVADETVTLTVLPVDECLYKVVYYGAILGAVRNVPESALWEVVPPQELTAGDLPFYQEDPNTRRASVVLDCETAAEIGDAIEKEKAQANC
jgi:hypothetical protein